MFLDISYIMIFMFLFYLVIIFFCVMGFYSLVCSGFGYIMLVWISCYYSDLVYSNYWSYVLSFLVGFFCFYFCGCCFYMVLGIFLF